MMGQFPPAQSELFYDFCLDRYVTADHFLRQIDAVLDLDGLRHHLVPFDSTLGRPLSRGAHPDRPSIDPELMIPMLPVGYCFDICSLVVCSSRSAACVRRSTCTWRTAGSAGSVWRGRYRTIPRFLKNRHRWFRDSEVFRYVFEEFIRTCMAEGLVKAEGFATDASTVSSRQTRAVTGVWREKEQVD